jgi:hypothetical protein
LGDDQVVAYATLGWSMLAGPLEAKHDPKSSPSSASTCVAGWPTLGRGGALNVLGWLYVSQERFEGTAPLRRDARQGQGRRRRQFIGLAEVNLAEYFLDRGDAEQAADLLPRARRAIGPCGCGIRSRTCSTRPRAWPRRGASDRGGDVARRALPPARRGRRVGWGSQLDRRERLVDELRTTLGAAAFADASRAARHCGIWRHSTW